MNFGLVKSNFHVICPWNSPLITRIRQIPADFSDCRQLLTYAMRLSSPTQT